MDSSGAGTSRLALYGPDHVVSGDVATAAAGRDLALALSAGAHPKARPSIDPNEDVAAVAAGAGRTMLVVADGHGGHDAPVAAVHHLLESLDPLPWTLDEASAHGVLLDAARAAAGGQRSRRSRSRTTVMVALASGPRLWWAAIGDSALFVVDGSGARRLDRPTHNFVGAPMALAGVRHVADVGSAALPPGTWVCLVSDGFVDYARPGPEDALADILGAGADTDADTDAVILAERLVRRAFGGGAGDNVAVALGRF